MSKLTRGVDDKEILLDVKELKDIVANNQLKEPPLYYVVRTKKDEPFVGYEPIPRPNKNPEKGTFRVYRRSEVIKEATEKFGYAPQEHMTAGTTFIVVPDWWSKTLLRSEAKFVDNPLTPIPFTAILYPGLSDARAYSKHVPPRSVAQRKQLLKEADQLHRLAKNQHYVVLTQQQVAAPVFDDYEFPADPDDPNDLEEYLKKVTFFAPNRKKKKKSSRKKKKKRSSKKKKKTSSSTKKKKNSTKRSSTKKTRKKKQSPKKRQKYTKRRVGSKKKKRRSKN